MSGNGSGREMSPEWITSMTPSLFNGERVVVLLYITTILFSSDFSLLPHALALSLLSLTALFLEIFAESSNVFLPLKTRPGASSGILLGAVTLPALNLSKLIQLSRALLLEQVETQEFKYQSSLFWVTSACCYGVLVYMFFVIQCTKRGNGSFSRISWRTMFGCLVICCAMILSTDYDDGLHLVLILSWMVCHSIAAVTLFQHILLTFPLCASIGEALLVTAGLIVYCGDMVTSTLIKIHQCVTSWGDVEKRVHRSEISTIIQGVLIGLLLFPWLLKIAVNLGSYLRSTNKCTAWTQNDIGRSIIFFGSLAVYVVLVIPSWLQFVNDFHVHPLLWVFMFVFSEPLKRLSLCIYWLGLVYISVCRFYSISKNSKIERILLRKYYHLLAVSMFVPALVLQPNFLNLAFGVALAAFLILEIIRVWRIWPLGEFIHQFMNAFTDHRDSDVLIVSHFSLLLGCAIPIWMSSGFNDRPLAPFAGILSLGIGDTMASMVGHKYGVLRWSKTGRKTIEGTAAGITSVLAACLALLPVLASTGYILTQNWCSLLVAVTVSGLLEAYTAQLDNAFIPLVFYSLLSL